MTQYIKLINTNIYFEDWLLAATAYLENNMQKSDIHTYDQGFEELGSINRMEL